jgi:hypothetical protein
VREAARVLSADLHEMDGVLEVHEILSGAPSEPTVQSILFRTAVAERYA